MKRVFPSGDDRGFMMVAMLMGMAIMAIWMAAAVPKWIQQVQRTREEDLIFRGEQYARALVLFQDFNNGANPMDLDILVSQHHLRKKWKDPVTNCEFDFVGVGIVSKTNPCPVYDRLKAMQPLGSAAPVAMASGKPGITGVRSKSQATSIKVYQNQTQHHLWAFDANLMRPRMFRMPQQQQQPGRGNPAGGRPGEPPGRGAPAGPGGPGRAGSGGAPGGAPVPLPPGRRGGGQLPFEFDRQ